MSFCRREAISSTRLVRRTGSVASSFLVHVGYNGTEMFLLLLATDGFRHMEKAALAVF